MLSHRLGLYRNAYDNKLEEGHDTRFLRRSLSQLNLICPPGTCWSYQNVAYDGSSEIVERVTHKTYASAPGWICQSNRNGHASVTREGCHARTGAAHDAARARSRDRHIHRVPAARVNKT